VGDDAGALDAAVDPRVGDHRRREVGIEERQVHDLRQGRRDLRERIVAAEGRRDRRGLGGRRLRLGGVGGLGEAEDEGGHGERRGEAEVEGNEQREQTSAARAGFGILVRRVGSEDGFFEAHVGSVLPVGSRDGDGGNDGSGHGGSTTRSDPGIGGPADDPPCSVGRHPFACSGSLARLPTRRGASPAAAPYSPRR
jgi:hypothetical protein